MPRLALPVFALGLALTLAIVWATPASAALNTSGRWTLKTDSGAEWEGLPIHLVLTRGYGSYHSQILWYNSHDVVDYEFEGDVWGWNAPSTGAAADCSAYPTSCFTSLGVSNPAKNVFCSGHTVLSNGRVLVAGGTESGETGLRHLTLFDPATRTWSQQPDMSERRWYPTNTALPDGRALISSGSTYTHLWSFGGRNVPDSGTPVSDSLQRLAGVVAAEWGSAVKFNANSQWPSARDANSGRFVHRPTG